MSISKSEKWLEIAYELFAKEGPEGIQVERLARALHLNKSGYYHYFGDSSQFMGALLQYHHRIALRLAQEITLCKNIDPDFFELAVNYKLCLLFQGQLLRRETKPLYGAVSREVREIIDKPLLPLWSKCMPWEHDSNVLMKCFDLLRNSFYARANYNNLTYQYLHSTLTETGILFRRMLEVLPNAEELYRAS